MPLFGAAEPTEFTRWDEPFATTVLRRARTVPSVVEGRFVPLVVRLVEALERPEAAGWAEAELIRDLNRYFVRFDHRASFRSEGTWRAFRDTVLAQEAGSDVEVTLGDLVQGLRWLYSFLLPITLPVPRADVTHATLAGFAGLAGVIAKLERGTPLMVTDHGIYLRERYIAMSGAADSFFLKRFLLRLVHLVSRVCYVTADQVSPVCHHNTRWETRMGVADDRIRTIYNGIDTDLFRPPETEPEGRRPTVVTAARVFPLKDIETLVRACEVTRRRGARRPLRGLRRQLGRQAVHRPLRGAGRQAGRPGPLHVRRLPRHAVGAVPRGRTCSRSRRSRRASRSRSIEAMACGRPVVATDVGGVKEALVDGVGIVVPPRGFEPLGGASPTCSSTRTAAPTSPAAAASAPSTTSAWRACSTPTARATSGSRPPPTRPSGSRPTRRRQTRRKPPPQRSLTPGSPAPTACPPCPRPTTSRWRPARPPSTSRQGRRARSRRAGREWAGPGRYLAAQPSIPC